MSLVPFKDRDERLLYIDQNGSGLVMFKDKLLNNFGVLQVLVPGKLTDAARISDTSLLAIEGAQITSLTTGKLWQVIGGAWGKGVTPIVGDPDVYQSLVSGAGIGRSAPALFDIFDVSVVASRRKLALPGPYSAVGPGMVHPSVLFVPQGWMGYRFWMAYTPYPNSNSDYENPCIACSQDGNTWVTPVGAANPLVEKPSGGYSADTHLILSPDSKTLYIAYRNRLAPTANNIMIMESGDGKAWSAPRVALTGLYASQDYGSPSIFWDAANSRWMMISHNLDGGATYPMQRSVTSGEDIYTGWSAPTTITIANPTGGRTWWHSSFDRMSDGRIVGLVQDIVNSGAGAPGALFAAESLDNGLTFAVKLIYSDLAYYRSCLSITDPAYEPVGAQAWIGRQQSTFDIYREDWASGADKRARDAALQEIANFGSYPSSVLWYDTFNRADGAIGTHAVGSALTVATGTFTIASNRIITGSAGGNHATVSVDVGDYAIETKITAQAGQWWICFRGVDTNNYWRVGVGVGVPDELFVQNILAGAINSSVQVSSVFAQAGDSVRIVCRGGRFRIYLNGTFCAEVQDVAGRMTTGVRVGIRADNAGNSFDYLLVMR